MNAITDLYGKRKGHAMPSTKSVEEEFADYVPQDVRREITLEEGSRKMERMKGLLTEGLTAAYKDGAAALEAAIEESNKAVLEKQDKCRELDKQLDAFKRHAAEQIMQYSQRAKELTAEVEQSIEHLREMTKWSEEQRTLIKNPLRPVALPSPPDMSPIQTRDD